MRAAVKGGIWAVGVAATGIGMGLSKMALALDKRILIAIVKPEAKRLNWTAAALLLERAECCLG